MACTARAASAGIGNGAPSSGDRVLVMHDSCTLWLLEILSELFREIVFFHGTVFDFTFVEDFRPSLVLCLQIERFFGRVPDTGGSMFGFVTEHEQAKQAVCRFGEYWRDRYPLEDRWRMREPDAKWPLSSSVPAGGRRRNWYSSDISRMPGVGFSARGLLAGEPASVGLTIASSRAFSGDATDPGRGDPDHISGGQPRGRRLGGGVLRGKSLASHRRLASDRGRGRRKTIFWLPAVALRVERELTALLEPILIGHDLIGIASSWPTS